MRKIENDLFIRIREQIQHAGLICAEARFHNKFSVRLEAAFFLNALRLTVKIVISAGQKIKVKLAK